MPQFLATDHEDGSVFFESSTVEAVFSDGKNLAFDSKDIRVHKSGAGKDDVIEFTKQDDSRYVVRLYLTTPETDWRRNATYLWRLSMAWMSIPSASSVADGQQQWSYWNVENNIKSDIQAYDNTPLLSTELITIHFGPMSRKWRITPPNKITLQNVVMGARLSSVNVISKHDNASKLKLYRPCSSSICEIVDGKVTSVDTNSNGPGSGSGFAASIHFGIVFVALGIALLMIILFLCRAGRHQRVKQKYAPIAEENNDTKTDYDEGQVDKFQINESSDEGQRPSMISK